MCPNHYRADKTGVFVRTNNDPHLLGMLSSDECRCCGLYCDECLDEERTRQKCTEVLRASKDELFNLAQSSGEAPTKKLRLVEDQVMQEINETMAENPPRRRRKKRRKEDGTPRRSEQKSGDETMIPVPDSEMETETDMDATTIDYNDFTSASHPERFAEAQSRHELELLGKRQRLDREIEEQLSRPLGSI